MNKLVTFLTITILLSCSYILWAQKSEHPFFLGIIPSVTMEPYYLKNEMDINIFPIVFQQKICNRVDYRISTILNLGLRQAKNQISHIGFQGSLPIFIIKSKENGDPSKGFYIAPGVGFTRNLIEKHTNIGLWAEPGYSFLFEDHFAITIGVQFGATHFNYDDGTKKWGNHFGIKIVLGQWLSRVKR